MREIKSTDLVGKTIKGIDNSSINVLRLEFIDGTNIEIWAEDAVETKYGNIPGFFVSDD